MTSYNEYYANGNNAYRRLTQAVSRRNWHGNARILITTFGYKNLKYMYYAISLN